MIYILVCKVEELPDPTAPMPTPDSDQIGDFYVRLGMAIAAWQFVEADLVHVYSASVKSWGHDAIAASFHVPTSFRVRLNMTDEAVGRAGLPVNLVDEWKALYKRLRKKGDRRNDIAHSVVIWQPQRKDRNKHLFLAASPSDPTRSATEFHDKDIITQNDLDNLISAFSKLGNDVTKFYRKVYASLMPPPTSPSP
jgi:hypothetical protein